jgi:hypothetical protein
LFIYICYIYMCLFIFYFSSNLTFSHPYKFISSLLNPVLLNNFVWTSIFIFYFCIIQLTKNSHFLHMITWQAFKKQESEKGNGADITKSQRGSSSHGPEIIKCNFDPCKYSICLNHTDWSLALILTERNVK